MKSEEDDDDMESDDFDSEDEDPMGAESKPGATEKKRADTVLKLLPVHAAPTLGGKGKSGNALKVARGPGRPRKVERMPTTSDLQYHALMSEEKAKFIDSDTLVQAARSSSDPGQMLKIIRTEVAKEAAALQFQRIENEKFGKDTAQVSSRRVDALTKIANIEMEIKKLGTDAIDLRSEKFQKVFALWIEIMREAATDTLTPEQIDLFFNRFSTKIEGWEERANDALR